jgi:pyrimidine-nucleoside phosphorylase/thymidine phosphorylase
VNPYELIRAKRDGRELSAVEVEYLVSGFAGGTIPDYQLAAFLMAVCFRGMSARETTALALAMMNSGKVFDLSDVPGAKIDKHSTGGVGDKVSLLLAPLVAACGVRVPMVSGRGLGHTGGTLDKLEAVPGFRTDLKPAEFRRCLRRLGVAMMGQTGELAPADKKMYALRDVTATVESIPLIAASIMSKKLAEGIDGLVLDVKTGNGAFMAKPADARCLARTMIGIGKGMGKRVTVLITRMDQPLGNAVGNAVEVVETVAALRGECPEDLRAVALALGQEMLRLGLGTTAAEARARLARAWQDGSALDRFRQMVRAQGGDERIVDDLSRLPQAGFRVPVKSRGAGYVRVMDTLRIGLLAVRLGAGRQRLEDRVDPAVGLWFRKKLGDRVGRGDVLAEVLANRREPGRQIAAELADCYTLGRERPARRNVIVERIAGT